jgi:hypothetical protein
MFVLLLAGCASGSSGAGVLDSTTIASAAVPQPGGAVSVGTAPSAVSAAPAVALPADWSTFTSERFGYAIDYPTGWTVTPAEADWPDVGWPSPTSTSVDRFEPSADAPGEVTVSSDVLAADEVAAARRAEIDQESALTCQISHLTTVTIDGAAGRQEDAFCFGRDHLIDVFLDSGKRIFLIDWFSSGTEISDVDRAIFAEMLRRFQLTD